MLKKALHNQSINDFLLTHLGTSVGAVAFAIENSLSITDELVPGSFYRIPDGIQMDAEILKFYTENGYRPATAIDERAGIPSRYGIGKMVIGSTFKVG